MSSEARRAAIRKQYRLFRASVEKTQREAEMQARLDAGRYWKIENGYAFPTDEERKRLARVLKVPETDLPYLSEQVEARAS